jgi:deoxyribodipyrimidine photo-lyase
MSTVVREGMVQFPTLYNDILQRVGQIDPEGYARSRNYIDGAVTRLSPYISRGVISTKLVFQTLIEEGHPFPKMEKFAQELAWRDYWQQVWVSKGDLINTDLKHPQEPVENKGMPMAILEGNTGIEAIDRAIAELYQSGYMHNHLRMYVASMVCNLGRSHWHLPAKWMYFHLLDADWASNALSWQWVAGANSHKKYHANQENINKYCHSQQKNTFLDVEYGTFDRLPIPKPLAPIVEPQFETPLPLQQSIQIKEGLPTLIYNFYNLDPLWKKNSDANRIILLEPSHFKKYPVSKKSIDFVLELSNNIPNAQIYVGSFDSLRKDYALGKVFYKEHPLNKHYQGMEEPRDWMFKVQGYYPSFFAFWKKCKKEMKNGNPQIF